MSAPVVLRAPNRHPPQRLLATALALVYALLTVFGAGLQLCRESDGAVNIEFRRTVCCSAPETDVAATVAQPASGALLAPDDGESCDGCVDQPYLADAATSRRVQHPSAAVDRHAPALDSHALPARVALAPPARRGARAARCDDPPPDRRASSAPVVRRC